MNLKERWEEFKKFALRGNVIDLAVGVVVGGAFGKITTSLVNDIIMPALGIITGKIDFSNLKYVIVEAGENVPELAIRYGNFIQTVVDFFIISISIFMFVRLINTAKFLHKKETQEEPPAPPPPPEPPRQEVLLEEIRDLLKEFNENRRS